MSTRSIPAPRFPVAIRRLVTKVQRTSRNTFGLGYRIDESQTLDQPGHGQTIVDLLAAKYGADMRIRWGGSQADGIMITLVA